MMDPIDVIGLMVAVFLDVFGLLCAHPSLEIFSFIPDVIGFAFFAVWTSIKNKEANFSILKSKKSRRKFLMTFVGEAIPFVGMLPFWTIFVISEIRAKK